MKNFFTVYSQRLAGYLMMNGFPLVRIVQDSKTGKDDYLFINSDLLHKYITRWQTEKNKNNSE